MTSIYEPETQEYLPYHSGNRRCDFVCGRRWWVGWLSGRCGSSHWQPSTWKAATWCDDVMTFFGRRRRQKAKDPPSHIFYMSAL